METMDRSRPIEKKSRSQNYTAAERELFLGLVDEYKQILESKKTSTVVLNQKNVIWGRVCAAYNASSTTSGKRTVKQLRRLYENIKNQMKKSSASEHIQNYLQKVYLPADECKDLKLDVANDEVMDITATETLSRVEESVESTSNNDDPVTEDCDLSSHVTLNHNEHTKMRPKLNYKEKYFKLKYKNALLQRIMLIKNNKKKNLNLRKEAELLNMRLKKETELLNLRLTMIRKRLQKLL